MQIPKYSRELGVLNWVRGLIRIGIRASDDNPKYWDYPPEMKTHDVMNAAELLTREQGQLTPFERQLIYLYKNSIMNGILV